MTKKIKYIGNSDNNSTLSPLLTNTTFNSGNDELFSIGSFSVTNNINKRTVVDYSNDLSIFSAPITLEVLNIDTTQSLINISANIDILTLNFDKKNLLNYALYGSLTDRIRVAIEDIIKKWVGSLYIYNQTSDGSYYDNINNYTYDSLKNESTFNVPTFLIQNTFNLLFTANSSVLTSSDDLKNLNQSYNKYVLYDLNTNISYKINNFIGSYSNSAGYITITTEGNPYPQLSTGSTTSDSVMFHVKPNDEQYSYFYNSLDSLQKYLLNNDSSPKYTILVKIPMVNDDDQSYFIDKKYTWTTSDGYNIDVSNSLFGEYFNSLIDLGVSYDNFKSDIIYRMFMPPNVKDMDLTDIQKSKQFSRVLGRELDEIKSFINGLTYINSVSYDKVDNIPDKLVKNLATTLGWKSFNILETEDLFASIFNNVTTDETPTQSTIVDLDIELWRRIIMNSNYLFKAKGTRKAIEAIFNFIGVPSCLIDLNEHVYTVSGKINPETVVLDNIFPLNLDLTILPYDKQGYPVASNEISNFYFQKAGDSDSGQEYINIYRNLGFEVTKTIDNKKSWVYTETGTTRFNDFTTNNTDYYSESSKLIINTKEIGINLDPIRAIECDVYSFNSANNYPVSNVGGRPYPYPSPSSNAFAASALTFSQYITQVYSTFVNVQNRKTVDDGKGGGYPSLTKLYYDYLKRSYEDTGIQSNEYGLRKMFNYLKNFQSYYTKFFDQLIPATTIVGGDGIKIRNTIFTPQKFVYKHGIDYSSQFKTKQTEVLSDTITSISNNINSVINVANKITFRNWESNGSYVYSTDGSTGGPTDDVLSILTILSPRNNWKSEIFVFDVPEYTMFDSADKIQSGITNNAIYYYDNDITNIGKPIDFIFTGNTNSLSGNNTTFKYEIYAYNSTLSGFSSSIIYNDYVTNNYFITGNTIYDTIIPKNEISGDSEYLIKGYFNKHANSPTANTLTFNTLLDYYGTFDKYIYPVSKDYYERYFDYTLYSGYTGTTISTQDNVYSNNNTVINYNLVSDWYFISLYNPLKPQLLGLDDNSNNNLYLTSFYKYELLYPNVNNEILLTYTPIGDIQLTINGSSLIKDVEYVLKSGLPISLANRVYNILVDYSGATDTLTVGYLADANSNNYAMANDSTYIDYTIPSGTTQVLPYKTLYNTSNNKYELYLEQNVSGDTNSVQITWNGLSLQPYNDYNLSITDKNRIIFENISLSTYDTLVGIYITGNTNTTYVTNITTNPYQFQWEVSSANIVTDKINGYYQLEFSTKNDINFTGTTIISSINENPYVNTVSSYVKTVDFSISPYNTLIGGDIYNIRVKNTKLFTSISGDIYPTVNYSDNKLIKIPY